MLAMHNVALGYCSAQPPDLPAAVLWFRRAGEGGYARASINCAGLLQRLGRLGEAEAVLQRVQQQLSGPEGGRGKGELALVGQLLLDVRKRLSGEGEGKEAAPGDLALHFPSVQERDEALAMLHSNAVSMKAVLELLQSKKK